MPRWPRASRCMSSSCSKPREGSCCYRSAGYWNGPSRGHRCRRLVKDYERYAATIAGVHVIAFVGYMPKRATDLMPNA